jgi:hypothetical protein
LSLDKTKNNLFYLKMEIFISNTLKNLTFLKMTKMLTISLLTFIGALPTIVCGIGKTPSSVYTNPGGESLEALEICISGINLEQVNEEGGLTQDQFADIQHHILNAVDYIRRTFDENPGAIRNLDRQAQIEQQRRREYITLMHLDRFFNAIQPVMHIRDIRNVVYEAFNFTEENTRDMELIGEVPQLDLTQTTLMVNLERMRLEQEDSRKEFFINNFWPIAVAPLSYVMVVLLQFSSGLNLLSRGPDEALTAILITGWAAAIGVYLHSYLTAPEVPLRRHENFNTQEANRAMLALAFFRLTRTTNRNLSL